MQLALIDGLIQASGVVKNSLKHRKPVKEQKSLRNSLPTALLLQIALISKDLLSIFSRPSSGLKIMQCFQKMVPEDMNF